MSEPIEIRVQRGYHPNHVTVAAGEPSQLKFIRDEAVKCTREVVFPALGLRQEVPTGNPVTLKLPALPPGDYVFTCGFAHLQGTLTVE
jgi:plastocyanin domain-containing protein